MKPRLLFALTLCWTMTCPAFGWWNEGHRTIARLAAARLTPSARTAAARILGVPDTPEAVAEALATASTWADDTKGQTKTGEWHYIDLALQDKKSDIDRRCPNDNCITARVRLFSSQLSKKTKTGITDLDALRYLVHLVGDLEQPLHTVSDADAGGNCEQITPFGTAKNLHALWDGGMLREIEPDDRKLTENLEGYIRKLSWWRRREWSRGDERDWAWESHELADRVIYKRLHIPLEPPVFPQGCKDAPAEIANFKPQIDSLYINDMKPILRDQLVKGGLRLARVLNQTL